MNKEIKKWDNLTPLQKQNHLVAYQLGWLKIGEL